MCSIPLYMDHFDGLRLKEHLDFDYADDLSILDESVSKMNEFFEVCESRVLK